MFFVMCEEMQDERERREKESSKAEQSASTRLYTSAQWLIGAEEHAKRRFLTGLLVRCHSQEILESVQNVLQVTLGKDFTYTRSRVKAGDMASNSNSAPDAKLLGKEMLNTWEWFKTSSNLMKMNYLLGLLAFCDADLLHVLGNLARVLIAREQRNTNFQRCNLGNRLKFITKLYLLTITFIKECRNNTKTSFLNRRWIELQRNRFFERLVGSRLTNRVTSLIQHFKVLFVFCLCVFLSHCRRLMYTF